MYKISQNEIHYNQSISEDKFKWQLTSLLLTRSILLKNN
jgi:hypothetical protein